MNNLFTALAWVFLFLASLFLLGLLKPFARHFYPGAPGVLARSAAPVIFSCLAIACFSSVGLQAMLVVLVAGIIQIAISHRYRGENLPLNR